MRALLVALTLLVLARPAHAQDAFEIQVYNSETASRGTVGFELHTNHVAVGSRTGTDGELPSQNRTHLTIEPHVGLASWCEVGAYFQTALLPDGNYQFAGMKMRFKMRVPHLLGDVVGLALNQEIAAIPAQFESHRFGWEIRPVIDATWRYVYASVNPIVAVDIAGPDAGRPQFEPAAKLGFRVTRFLMLGAEYYGAVGRFDRPLARDEQIHRGYLAMDFEWTHRNYGFEMNLGAGYGFTGDDRWVAKMIFAVDYQR